MSVQDLSTIRVAYKAQAELGTAVSGAGAVGLDVVPSQGIAMQVASIESALIQKSRMRKRPRHGSKSVTAAYETELMVGSLDTAFEAVLGGTWTASQTLTEAELTSCAVSASGATVTFAGGDIISEGVRVGMMAKLADMTTAGNNGKWFPILGISANGRVITTIAGILTDEAADSAFSLVIAKAIYTAATYEDRYFTLEEHWEQLDLSKLATDCKFNQLSFSAQPDSPTRVSLGLGGRDLELLASGDSPNFTDPTYTEGQSLVLLDGAIYVNGVARANVTGLTAGLAAPVSTLPVIGSRTSPDTFLGQFAFTGEFAAAVEDGTDFAAFVDETDISMFLHFAEAGTDNTTDFVSVYVGNLSYGGHSSPVGGEGALIQTLPLYGGEDERGTGYASTTMLISTSAA